MTLKEQGLAMQAFIVNKLEGFGVEIEPRTREIGRKKASYILVGGEEGKGIVLLIDPTYTEQDFLELYRKAKRHKKDVAVVVFKDGKTFFRSARYRGHQRRKPDRSLKKYSKRDLQNLLMLHPLEVFLADHRTYTQYYQPESPRLREGIECFQFKPAVYDYSHLSPEARFGSVKRSSEKLFFWTYRIHLDGDLVLDGDYLKDRRAVEG